MPLVRTSYNCVYALKQIIGSKYNAKKININVMYSQRFSYLIHKWYSVEN